MDAMAKQSWTVRTRGRPTHISVRIQYAISTGLAFVFILFVLWERLKMLLYWSATFFLAINAISATDPIVDLDYARYQGVALENGVSQWLGMRYAAPPLGSLRFEAPQDPWPKADLQHATQHGKICLSTPGNSNPAEPGKSEDCLFINVFAPSNATVDSKLPVYFFIQGGGFNILANTNYNGSGLVEASGFNIVVVTFNYRVGLFGFLSGKEVYEKASVNNGLKDQRKALEWVQNYIAEFGGDPDHVVLGGASAGAASITLQLTAYGGRNDGLFHASAAESQSFGPVFTVNETQYQYDSLVTRTGCSTSADSLACLRNLTSIALQKVNINLPSPGAQQPPLYMYNPVIDDDFIRDYTFAAFAKGNFVHLPAIYGDDTNEGTIFAPRSTNTLTASDIFIQNQFPNVTKTQIAVINSLYPNPNLTFPNSGAYWRQASTAYGEIRYICPGLFVSSVYTTNALSVYQQRSYPPPSTYIAPSTFPVYNYRYNVRDQGQISDGLGVPHTVEVTAIFGPSNVNGAAPASYTGANAWVVPVIQAYWTSFIRTFDPNTYRLPNTPIWESFTLDGMDRFLFDGDGNGGNTLGMETVSADQKVRCEYLWTIAVDLQQ